MKTSLYCPRLDDDGRKFLGILEKPPKNKDFTGIGSFCYISGLSRGQVAERLKALVSKTSIGVSLSRVRIPPCPPFISDFSAFSFRK
jgi:hypothetical protein